MQKKHWHHINSSAITSRAVLSANLISVSKRGWADHPGEEAGVVVADEGVVLREDVVSSGEVKPRDKIKPDGQRMHPVVAQHPGAGV